MSRRTGFPPHVCSIIDLRSQGFCERCGRSLEIHGYQRHHRRPRGAGGSKDPATNKAANGLILCPGCHEWAESHRAVSLSCGFLVRQSVDPALVPVKYRSRWVLLDNAGSVIPVPQLEAS